MPSSCFCLVWQWRLACLLQKNLPPVYIRSNVVSTFWYPESYRVNPIYLLMYSIWCSIPAAYCVFLIIVSWHWQVELNGKIDNPSTPEFIHSIFSTLAFVSDGISSIWFVVYRGISEWLQIKDWWFLLLPRSQKVSSLRVLAVCVGSLQMFRFTPRVQRHTIKMYKKDKLPQTGVTVNVNGCCSLCVLFDLLVSCPGWPRL